MRPCVADAHVYLFDRVWYKKTVKIVKRSNFDENE